MILNESYGFKDRKIYPKSLTNLINYAGKTEMALGIDFSWIFIDLECKLEPS